MSHPASRDLDLLLGAWASRQRLPQDRADDIRQAITAPPAPAALPAAWWGEFNARIGAVMVHASRSPTATLAGVG